MHFDCGIILACFAIVKTYRVYGTVHQLSRVVCSLLRMMNCEDVLLCHSFVLCRLREIKCVKQGFKGRGMVVIAENCG